MNEIQFQNILACHTCKRPLILNGKTGYCQICKIRVKQIDGIWHCLKKLASSSQSAKKAYELIFTREFGEPRDGSYEILAAIARGNRCVDIACGTGTIEKLSPSTVGVDFSLTALKQARKNGARQLVLADAHALPFIDNAFEVAISAGNLEHFENPMLALSEMARISKIQMLIVHRFAPIPFAKILYKLTTKLFHIQHQPLERPFTMKELDNLLTNNNLHAIFKGVWSLPFNYGRVIKWLPELNIFPSAWFVLSIKK